MASRFSSPPLAAASFEAWEALVAAYWRLSAPMDQAMADAGLPPLAWYDVLSTLERAPRHRLRMSQLAERVLLSRSGLTRLVDRLEKHGLLRRAACADDGRGLLAELTPPGRNLLRRMWPVYRKSISQYFAAQLTSTEAAQLTAWMRRLMSSLPGQSLEANSVISPANPPATARAEPEPQSPANTRKAAPPSLPRPEPPRRMEFEFDPLLD